MVDLTIPVFQTFVTTILKPICPWEFATTTIKRIPLFLQRRDMRVLQRPVIYTYSKRVWLVKRLRDIRG